MNNFKFHSFEQQDEFVINIFDQKRNGFFLDVGAGHTLVGSNTYALEQSLDWTGIGFDLFDAKTNYQWEMHRNSKFECVDITTVDFTNYLKDNIPETLIVDYLSLDVDQNGGSAVTLALERILDADVKFKSVTLEHESFLHGNTYKGPTREILEGLGFIRLFEDVKAWTIGSRGDGTEFFEDWWIHPQYFDADLLNAQRSRLYSFECIEALKENRGNSYICTHRCSQAFPNEYDLYYHDGEQRELLKIFEQFPR